MITSNLLCFFSFPQTKVSFPSLRPSLSLREERTDKIEHDRHRVFNIGFLPFTRKLQQFCGFQLLYCVLQCNPHLLLDQNLKKKNPLNPLPVFMTLERKCRVLNQSKKQYMINKALKHAFPEISFLLRHKSIPFSDSQRGFQQGLQEKSCKKLEATQIKSLFNKEVKNVGELCRKPGKSGNSEGCFRFQPEKYSFYLTSEQKVA